MNLPRTLIFSRFLAVLLTAIASGVASAHAPGENYVWVNVNDDHLSGRFEIHLDDLNRRLGVSWEEFGTSRVEGVTASAEKVQAYLRDHFQIVVHGRPLEITFQRTDVFNENGNYAQYFYRTEPTDIPDRFSIRNDILLSSDEPLHRSLIVLEYNRKLDAEYGGENAIMVFSPYNTEQELDLRDLPSLLQPSQFIWQGILHIWIGIDHILFLAAAAVVRDRSRKEKWEGVSTFKTAFWNVFKIVTNFHDRALHHTQSGCARFGQCQFTYCRIIDCVVDRPGVPE